MKRLDHILFVADGSPGQEAAFRRALRLAGDRRASLTVMRAPGVQFDPPQHSQSQASTASGDTTPDIVDAPATPDEIVRLVERQHCDLVIKSAAERRRGIAAYFNDPDARLLRDAPCPVWIMKRCPGEDRRTRILAAVNPVSTNPGCQGLAPQVLEIAALLAENEQSELHVVNAWHVAGEAMLRGRPIHVSQVSRLLQRIRTAHQQQLDRLLEQHEIDGTTVHVHKGRPDKVIRRLLRTMEFDDIVIGSRPERGPLATFRSGIAERILRSARCSVLAVKPA